MKHNTASDFPAEALQSPIQVIVDFSTQVCASMRALKPIFEELLFTGSSPPGTAASAEATASSPVKNEEHD